ncbi:MAG: DNA-directed DNA polymerase [Nanoarchaeota archaeon]
MATLNIYLVDISQRMVNDRAVICLYGRTPGGTQICAVDDNVLPYFYVQPRSSADAETLKARLLSAVLEDKGEKASVVAVERAEKKLLGKSVQLLKVFTNVPHARAVLADRARSWPETKACFEDDLSFTRRWLIDKGVIPFGLIAIEGEFINQKSKVPVFRIERILGMSEESLATPRVLAFDVQAYNPKGRELDPERNPIIMVAVHGEGFSKVFSWKRFPLAEAEFVDSELALIEKVREAIDAYKPDILVGYHSDVFDLSYLKARAEKYKIRLEIGLDFSEIRQDCSIVGITHVDIQAFAKRNAQLNEDLSLRALARSLVHEQGLDVDMTMLVDAWDNHPELLGPFASYSMRNAQLIFTLSQHFMPQLIELSRITGLPLFHASRKGYSQLVEWLLIRSAVAVDEITVNKPSPDEVARRRKATFTGASVLTPSPGIYKDVIVFDFQSLYPSIISALNIGPDTYHCSCCEGLSIPEEKGWFCAKRKGFMPEVLEDLITRRMRVKKILDEGKASPFLAAREHSLKMLANSFYGYLGFYGSRWYSLECAKAVAAYGRFYINKVIAQAKAWQFKVLYSDTDSVFLLLERKAKKEAMQFADKINLDLPGLMELSYEGFYPRAIFVEGRDGVGAKKRYALLSEHGDIIVKGMELGSWCDFVKEVHRQVVTDALKGGGQALPIVQDAISKLQKRRVPVEALVLRTHLKKRIQEYDTVGPHVAVARRMLAQGKSLGIGSRISFVIISGKEKVRDRARVPDEVRQDDIDPGYYIERQLIPAVEKVMQLLNIGPADFEKKQQSTLAGYF